MPYSRYAYRRRPLTFGRARRSRYSRTYPSNRATVRTAPRAEIKAVVDNPAALVLSNIGSVQGIHLPAQGTSIDDREGAVIRPLDMDLRLRFQSTSTGLANVCFRVVIIEWMQGFITPGVTSIFNNPAVDFCQAVYDQLGARNYRVMYDRMFTIKQIGLGNAGTFVPGDKVLSIKKRLSGNITFNGTTAADADRKYFLIVGTDFPSNSFVQMYLTSNLRWVDL